MDSNTGVLVVVGVTSEGDFHASTNALTKATMVCTHMEPAMMMWGFYVIIVDNGNVKVKF